MNYHRLTCTDPSGTHEIAYLQWGDVNNPQVIICLHGLTRNSHDFDFLATALAEKYQVICIDLPGRGQSDWLTNPNDYQNFSIYINDIRVLFNHLGITTVDLIGTSMGGVIGMILAAQHPSHIRRLILNDIGPFIHHSELQRLAGNIRKRPMSFSNFSQAVKFIREINAQFGQLSQAQWEHLTRHSIRERADGRYELLYDPNIFPAALKEPQTPIHDFEIWHTWRAMHCPVLVIRGEQSALLTEETINQMITIHPPTEVIRIPEVGHAPTLMNPTEIQIIQKWLTSAELDYKAQLCQ